MSAHPLRTLCLASTLTLFACSSPPSRPRPKLQRADSPILARLQIDESVRAPSPVAIIALPEPGTGDNQANTTATTREALTFEELMRSVEERFPLILAAIEELEIAEGQLLSARGGFDTKLKASGEFGVDGFYENEVGAITLEQPTSAWGATFFGGYDIGTGDFPVWEGDRKTQTDGEFTAGIKLPLLAGRDIDSRRLSLWKARIARAAAEPLVVQKRLEATRKAAAAYWSWVAAGQRFEIAERLLALAEDRQEGVASAVEEGELPRIALVENRRLVVEREAIVVRAERKLQRRAIALSLFWRTPEGSPIVPDAAILPAELPVPLDPELMLSDDDLDFALAQRPEVQSLKLELEKLTLETRKAENDTLPSLDVAVKGSKDIGDDVSTPDDKGPFELTAYVVLDVPLQRRGAKGRVRSLDGKSFKKQRELQYAKDRVIAEVQDAASALRTTWRRIDQVRENVLLAGELELAERSQLDEGESDLLRVNLREQQTAAAAAALVDVLAEHFRSIADYRASLGVPYDEMIRR